MKIYTPMYSKNQLNPKLNRSLLSCRVSSGAATTFHQPACMVCIQYMQWCASRFECFHIFPFKLSMQYGKPGSIRFLPSGNRFLVQFRWKYTKCQQNNKGVYRSTKSNESSTPFSHSFSNSSFLSWVRIQMWSSITLKIIVAIANITTWILVWINFHQISCKKMLGDERTRWMYTNLWQYLN